MNNNFNLKSFLTEGRLLNEEAQVDENLIKAGFTYDKDEDYWTVPEDYSSKTDSDELISYGIIWGLGGDYDTSPRETIGEFLADAAQEQA